MKQFRTADDIPNNRQLKEKNGASIIFYGVVVKVIDGDTIRVRHLPCYPFCNKQKHVHYQGKLSDNTISIRLYGIDCPETSKFGHSSMPYSEEATSYVKHRTKCTNTIKQKSDPTTAGDVVRIKVLSKDQYNRVVAKVKLKRRSFLLRKLGLFQSKNSDLSIDLLRKGFATVYDGGGAQYDNKKDILDQTLVKAQHKKKGMWCHGVTNVQTPAEFKRAVKAGITTNKSNSPITTTTTVTRSTSSPAQRQPAAKDKDSTNMKKSRRCRVPVVLAETTKVRS